MARVSEIRKKFVREYSRDFPALQERAKSLEIFLTALLRDLPVQIQDISSRAKSPDSVQLKILDKGYKRPRSQVTDKIAARIITYYSTDVDRVVARLKDLLEIDARQFTDKRKALGIRSFGYSSVQFVARLHSADARNPSNAALSGIWFEVQVRTILEHAWAEIEHEVVYKSGINYPDTIVRRFAAIAGALEIVAAEFFSLRRQRAVLIRSYRERYHNRRDQRTPFDAARLLGFLEIEFPGNLSWLAAEDAGTPFPPRMEARCVAALRSCRLATARTLRRLVRTVQFKEAMNRFAAASELGLPEVSHLALVLVAIGLKNPRTLRDFFPAMLEDRGIQAAIEATRTLRGD